MARRKTKRSRTTLALYMLAGVVIGATLALVGARYFGYLEPPGRVASSPGASREARALPEERVAPEPLSPMEELPPPAPAVPPGAPRLAVVIDDMGRSLEKFRDLQALGVPVTIAVLPHLRHSEATAFEAYSSGLEVIMHLPMEPRDLAHDPGRGALMTSMTGAEIRGLVEDDLSTVPYATGMNNHMGSRFTESEDAMRAVLETARDRGLFFLDSRTTGGSVVLRVARQMDVRALGRNVFLDNDRDEAYIRGQLRKAVELARERGRAVAIGHPYPETIKILAEILPPLSDRGVYPVTVTGLMEAPDFTPPPPSLDTAGDTAGESGTAPYAGAR